jgi:hypothetical protein
MKSFNLHQSNITYFKVIISKNLHEMYNKRQIDDLTEMDDPLRLEIARKLRS